MAHYLSNFLISLLSATALNPRGVVVAAAGRALNPEVKPGPLVQKYWLVVAGMPLMG